MKLDLLAIAAHPDDVELTCGGTLLKMAQRGTRRDTGLDGGEMGTRGTPETRAKEAARAAKILKVAWRERWRGGFGCGGYTSEQVAAGKGDPRVAAADGDPAVLGGAASGSLPRIGAGVRRVLFGGLKQLPLDGEPYRPFKILYATSFEGMPPTFVVDVTKQYEARRRAILAYGSQFRPAKSERSSGCTWQSMSLTRRWTCWRGTMDK